MIAELVSGACVILCTSATAQGPPDKSQTRGAVARPRGGKLILHDLDRGVSASDNGGADPELWLHLLQIGFPVHQKHPAWLFFLLDIASICIYPTSTAASTLRLLSVTPRTNPGAAVLPSELRFSTVSSPLSRRS